MSNNKSWPRVVIAKWSNVPVKVYKRGSGEDVDYQVVYWGADGKRKFLGKATEQEALELAEQKSSLLSSHGVRAATTSPDEVARFTHYRDQLAPVDVFAVLDAAGGWLKRFQTLAGIEAALTAQPVRQAAVIAKPLDEARAEYVLELEALVKNKKLSELHVNDIKSRLPRILDPFKCDVCTIDVATLQTRLDAMNGGNANYEHHRRVLSAFFGWCFRNHYHAENPAFTPKKNAQMVGRVYLEKRDVKAGKKLVFTPDEMQKIMDKCAVKFLPLFILCGFAGLRTTELARLKWSDIDFDAGRIIVGEDEDNRKTSNSFRSHVMADNLRAGLAQFKDHKGFIFPTRGETFIKTIENVNSVQRYWAKQAGVAWKKNGMRHGYISYRLVLKHPVDDIASDCGNSVEVIHRDYKTLRFEDGRFITEKDAKAWFALVVPQRVEAKIP